MGLKIAWKKLSGSLYQCISGQKAAAEPELSKERQWARLYCNPAWVVAFCAMELNGLVFTPEMVTSDQMNFSVSGFLVYTEAVAFK